MLLHEAGHWAAARLCGLRVRRLRLDAAGLCMETSPCATRREELLCATAGPAAGLLWLFPALRIGGDWGMRSAVAAAAVNVFNLLPALPLDGGRLLLSLSSDPRLVRITTALTVISLIALSCHFRRWGLLFAAVLILLSALSP